MSPKSPRSPGRLTIKKVIPCDERTQKKTNKNKQKAYCVEDFAPVTDEEDEGGNDRPERIDLNVFYPKRGFSAGRRLLEETLEVDGGEGGAEAVGEDGRQPDHVVYVRRRRL